MSREPGCGSFYIEGPWEELDAPSEYYYDRQGERLLFWPNASDPLPDQLVDPTMEEIVRIRGTQARPVHGVTILGITFRSRAATFRAAAKPFLSPHESTNSGADWAAPRRAAVAVEGAVNVSISACTFDHLGGNAVLWSNYVRHGTTELERPELFL